MPAKPVPFLVRFEEKINKQPGEESCWVWTGALNAEVGKGYGVIWFRGRQEYAHRLSYELYVGMIPEGQTIDHRCRNRACVRPDHLRVKSRGENVLIGEGPSAKNKQKTECVNGHLFDVHNTWVGKDGSRHCRSCARNRIRAKYRKDHGLPEDFTRFKTHCFQGHPMSGDNLYESPGGQRQCRTCNTIRSKNRRR